MMFDPDREAASAAFHAQRRREGRPVADLPASLRLADLAAGYRAQDIATDRLIAAGWGPLVGWKLGCTTPRMRDLIGVDTAIAGAMLARGKHASPATIRAADHVKLCLECEICFELGRPLGGEVTREEAAAAVARIHPAIEIVDDRYGDFRAYGAANLAADSNFHAGFVLGPAVEDWRGIDLAAVVGETLVDGVVTLTGRGEDVLGHPLESLVWLARALAARGKRLEAGQFVMSGSLPLPHWPVAGQTMEARLSGIGSAMVSII